MQNRFAAAHAWFRRTAHASSSPFFCCCYAVCVRYVQYQYVHVDVDVYILLAIHTLHLLIDVDGCLLYTHERCYKTVRDMWRWEAQWGTRTTTPVFHPPNWRYCIIEVMYCSCPGDLCLHESSVSFPSNSCNVGFTQLFTMRDCIFHHLSFAFCLAFRCWGKRFPVSCSHIQRLCSIIMQF